MGSKQKRAGRRADYVFKHHHKDSYPAPSSCHSSSVNPIKTKIRDVTRLLERSENLPAGVRIEKERALAGYKQDLEKAYEEKRKQQLISKYHMVRFFERQKATRNLKKLNSRLAKEMPANAEYADLKRRIHAAEVDVNYCLFFPLTEKYVALFPRSGAPDSNDQSSESKDEAMLSPSKPPLWGTVEQCMEQGNLHALRDGKLSTKASGSKNELKSKKSTFKPEAKEEPARQNRTARRIAEKEHDEDSDGGFFER